MSKYKKDNIYIDCQPVNSKGQTLVNMSKDDVLVFDTLKEEEELLEELI